MGDQGFSESKGRGEPRRMHVKQYGGHNSIGIGDEKSCTGYS